VGEGGRNSRYTGGGGRERGEKVSSSDLDGWERGGDVRVVGNVWPLFRCIGICLSRNGGTRLSEAIITDGG